MIFDIRADLLRHDSRMEEHLSTREVGWILGRSAGTVRDMIVAGEIEATRIVGGYRIPKAEALRLGRERIEAEAGRKLSDKELERLIDQVIETNQAATT
jgi:excisionase family DNA binding protein